MKEIKEIAEELWDSHSQQIGSDIDDLQYFAGRDVILKSGFEKALISFASQQPQPSGLRWVKATFEIFADEDWWMLHFRYNKDKVKLDTDLFEVVGCSLQKKGGTGKIPFEEIEVLDESDSPSPSPAQEAVDFAEWLSANSWSFWKTFPGSPIQEKKSVWINEDESMNGAEKPLPTTPELYQLFIKSKNK